MLNALAWTFILTLGLVIGLTPILCLVLYKTIKENKR